MKKLLELLGTILITTSAAGPLVANKPNNKIKNSLETLNRKKRQTPPTNAEQQIEKNNEPEFVEKEITLNENYSDNIQKILKELINENYINPLKSINMGGLISIEMDNKGIISKLNQLGDKIAPWIEKQKTINENILILKLKNINNQSIKLIINLNNFYLLGFINNYNQYFYFNDEKSKQIDDLKNKIKELGEKQNKTKLK